MSTDLVVTDNVMPAMSIEEAVNRFNAVVEFVRTVMKEGTDYGVIPGTGTKPTLLKPGAEKLCTLFGIRPKFQIVSSVEDWTGKDHSSEPFFFYHYKCQLWRGSLFMGEGDGSCNSWEKKYRYRDQKRTCPECGKEKIIKGKAEYGGGWICFIKQGGCGAKFPDNAPDIVSQQTGQVLNADVADIVNTLQKMSQKRALIAATLIAVNASEFFTQDIEDMTIDGHFTETEEPAISDKAMGRWHELSKEAAEAGVTMNFSITPEDTLDTLTERAKLIKAEIRRKKEERAQETGKGNVAPVPEQQGTQIPGADAPIALPWSMDVKAAPSSVLDAKRDDALISRAGRLITPKQHLANHLKNHYEVERYGQMTVMQGMALWAHLNSIEFPAEAESTHAETEV